DENVMTLTLGLMALALVAIIGAIVYFVSGAVTKPIEELAHAAHRVSEGDFAQQVRVSEPREAAELADAFNTMTANLRRNRYELEHSRTAFDRALQRLGDALAATHDLGAIVDVVLETTALTLDAAVTALFTAVSPRSPLEVRGAYGAALDGLRL